MADLEKILQDRFGYPSFRKGQLGIIDSILAGTDTMAVMPTGGGKSLCYQIPALVKEGVVIVVSPLIALMKDQVRQLKALKIPAGAIHSGQDFEDKKRIFQEMAREKNFILYLSPERVQTDGFTQWLKRNMQRVTLLAVDEAHCISQWGPDFREDYHRLGELRELAPSVPMLALTATATPPVLRDIIKQLKLKKPDRHVHGFYRPNLYYQVEICKDADEKYPWLEQAISQTPDGRVLIYCGTRKQTEDIAKHLGKKFEGVAFYHAGLSPDERTRVQTEYGEGTTRILAATNAFGMGIDHPDVRVVIHFQIPANIESLYQEMGRAGRDGADSTCLILYTKRDKGLHSYFITESKASADIISSRWSALDTLVSFAEVQDCRHAGILTYFKDPMRMKACGHCDVCVPGSERRIRQPVSRGVVEKPKSILKKKRAAKDADHSELTPTQRYLFDELKAWRKAWADEHDLPAFVVLSNRSLEALCKRVPKNLTELEAVHGFGPKKVESIGKEILEKLRAFSG